MRLQLLSTLIKAAISLLIICSVNIYALPVISRADSNNMNQITNKMQQLKMLENVIDNKTKALMILKKRLDNTKLQLDKKKKDIDNYVKQKKKEIELLENKAADDKIKKLAKIYASAKPQAAADELSEMDEKLTAKILTFMQPRKSGAIISKMDPKIAAKVFQNYVNKH